MSVHKIISLTSLKCYSMEWERIISWFKFVRHDVHLNPDRSRSNACLNVTGALIRLNILLKSENLLHKKWALFYRDLLMLKVPAYTVVKIKNRAYCWIFQCVNAFIYFWTGINIGNCRWFQIVVFYKSRTFPSFLGTNSTGGAPWWFLFFNNSLTEHRINFRLRQSTLPKLYYIIMRVDGLPS